MVNLTSVVKRRGSGKQILNIQKMIPFFLCMYFTLFPRKSHSYFDKNFTLNQITSIFVDLFKPMRPLRIEIFDAYDVDHKNVIYDIFNFRTGPIDPKIFDFPDLTPCKPSQSPKIPDFPEIFHMKMEVNSQDDATK